MPFRPALALGLFAALSLAPRAHADTFSSVVVFGDSLSDNGNLYKLTGYPPAPYYNGRFSNGPVAVEQLATNLGAPLLDYAFGGATTGIGNYIDGGSQTSVGLIGLPGMQQELGAFSKVAPSLPVSSSLFVVWGGANDYFADGSPSVAASNIDSIVHTLQAEGATHILVPGVPDLGLTPEFFNVAAATTYSEDFNTALEASLPAGATYVDTFDLLHAVYNDPAKYGFTNVTTPCLTAAGVCTDPNQHLFWDDVHPTTAADAILANEFASAATPEPTSLVLLGTGALGALALLRRRLHGVSA